MPDDKSSVFDLPLFASLPRGDQAHLPPADLPPPSEAATPSSGGALERSDAPPARGEAAPTRPPVSPQRKLMEDRLATLPLSFPPRRSDRWENAAFPNMAAIYLSLARAQVVPEQDVFAHAVATLMDQGDNPDVIARACRAYPALVRQHHFALVLKEHFPLVVRSEELDLHGVDLLVVENGRAYGIALSVQTDAAHAWQAVKHRRHPDPPGLPVLYLYAHPDGYRIGRFWLHPPEQVREVRAFIDQSLG